MRLFNGDCLSHEAERGEISSGMPQWVIDQLYQQFLDDYWSTGAGELSKKALDAEPSPKEVYVRALAQRFGPGWIDPVSRHRQTSTRLPEHRSQRCSA